MTPLKIAVSDFDGTLAQEENLVTKDDIAAIKDWQAAGHKFGLATGRGITMVTPILEKFGFKIDFLLATNGAVIFDENWHVLKSYSFPNKLTRKLLSEPVYQRLDHPMVVFTEKTAYSVVDYPEIPPELVTPAALGELMERGDIVQVSLRWSSVEENTQNTAAICEKFPALIGNVNRVFMDLTLKEVNKANGIAQLLRLKGWDDAQVYTIGDDKNDLAMIKKYNGSTVKSAKPFMHEATSQIYATVGEMLRANI